MKPSYDDIRKGFPGIKPSWYTKEGFPRYSSFAPGESDIYSKYSLLYEIACQSCEKLFLIGEDFSYYKGFYVAVANKFLSPHFVSDKILPGKPNPLEGYTYIDIDKAVYFPDSTDLSHSQKYYKFTLEDFIMTVSYGDPPVHDCIGDTMNSDMMRTVEVWDLCHGQVVQNGLVTSHGTHARISRLENLSFQTIHTDGFPLDSIET